MDNIRYGNRSATDEEVIRAAKTVCAHDFIMEMENGYKTQVNERGSRLSAGQRQLISFARALLADPKILILDEATAFADPDNEAKVQQAFSKLSTGKTVIMIAHRLSSVVDADRICVLKDGEIVESGTHKELSEAQKLYAHMGDAYNKSVRWKVGE